MQKILITGVTSIHGWPIWQRLSQSRPSCCLLGIRPPKMAIPDGSNLFSLCITAQDQLERIRREFQPTHVIHCSGVCDLDVCEQRPDWAESINIQGTRCVAEVFGKSCYLLYLSTDLVFSGNRPPAGGYSESHCPDPISVAGRTFAAAETQWNPLPNCAILRLGLPLGQSLTGQKGAIDFIDYRFRRNLPLTLFYDELRSCIDCATLAEVVLRFLEEKITGLYHLGGDRPWSLHEVGQYVIRRGSYPSRLLHTKSRFEERNGPPRIGNVSLNSEKLKQRLRLDKLI